MTVVPFAAPPVVRGWHGMAERPHAQYSVTDWSTWATVDPAGTARIVDVVPWSPAATVGIVSGDWILSLNGERMDLFDRRGAPVGTHVSATVHRIGNGPWTVDIVLVPPPARQRRQRPARPIGFPKIAHGRRLGPKERLKWETAMQEDPAVNARARDVANRLATKYADNRNMAWPGRARLARDLGVSVNTIDRAKAQLSHRGWVKWVSGRVTGEANRYFLTWPAGY